MIGYSLNAEKYYAPTDARNQTFDEFAGMNQLFAGVRTS
jgi:hypothetical protein